MSRHSFISTLITTLLLLHRAAQQETTTAEQVFNAERNTLVTDQAIGLRCALAADLDGDGRLDIISASLDDNAVSWYRNLGPPSLTNESASLYPDFSTKNEITWESMGIISLAVGDMDADGDVDVVGASYRNSSISWFENDGSGNFTQHLISDAAFEGQHVIMADLDNDGDPDIISSGHSIAVFINIDRGIFCELKRIIDSDGNGARTIAADLNADGWVDLASVSEDGGAVSWYPNDGAGNFPKKNNILGSGGSYSAHYLVAADIDMDGDLDLVVASQGRNHLYILRNDGDGHFEKTVIDDKQDIAMGVTAADFDRDGDIDIAITTYFDGLVQWYENIDEEGYDWELHAIHDGELGKYVLSDDIDGDGDYDIIAVDGNADSITIFFASSECDGDQEGVPNAECCLERSEWNGTMCKSCPFGTYGVGSGVNAKCIPCPTDECSVLGLNMIPITCGGLTGCVDVEGSLAECSCPTDSNLDYETDTCAPCTTGQVRPDIDQLRGIDTLGDYATWEEMQGTCSKQKTAFWTIFSVLSVCIVIIVGLTMLVWRQRRVIKYHTRDVNNAPRNGTIAIVFTDIEGSTALWEMSKTTMSKSLDVHHNTIRKVIDKHKGYEVKTIGDSFMIALDSADKAVCLANDIQEELLIADWPVELADMPWAGSEFHCSSGYKGPPKPLYRGLRVRIGIHIGKHSDSAEEGGNMQTKYDNVAKGYDYYGGAVNAASRIEQLAFGGQTLISSDVMGELSDGVKDKCSIHVVGAVQLRGIRQDVFIHQVLPRTLEGRTFRGVFRKSIVDDNTSSSSEHPNDFLVVRRSSILTSGSFLENEDLTRDVATLTPVELQATVVRLRNRIFVLQDEFSTHSRRGSSMTDAINESDIDFSVNDEQQIQTSDPDSGDGDDRVALEVMDVIRKIYHENSQSTVQKVANGVRNVDSD